MAEHILSYKKLMGILFLLLILTGVTVGASYVDLGAANAWVALLIAATKGSLVVLYFMHLKYGGRLLAISFVSTLFFLAIMISFTFWDIAFR